MISLVLASSQREEEESEQSEEDSEIEDEDSASNWSRKGKRECKSFAFALSCNKKLVTRFSRLLWWNFGGVSGKSYTTVGK